MGAGSSRERRDLRGLGRGEEFGATAVGDVVTRRQLNVESRVVHVGKLRNTRSTACRRQGGRKASHADAVLGGMGCNGMGWDAMEGESRGRRPRWASGSTGRCVVAARALGCSHESRARTTAPCTSSRRSRPSRAGELARTWGSRGRRRRGPCCTPPARTAPATPRETAQRSPASLRSRAGRVAVGPGSVAEPCEGGPPLSAVLSPRARSRRS